MQGNNGNHMQNQFDVHNHNLQQTIRSLEEQIEITIYNYEQILQTQKKTSTDRSQFLLYLIQSLRNRHNQQLQSVTIQLQQAEGQRQQAQTMQTQMQNIGQGLDHIVQQSRRLKQTNEQLQKQMQEQQHRQKQLDQEIKSADKQLTECRLKADQWERVKLKWNRHKKQLLEMIEDAQNDNVPQADTSSINYCAETGEDIENCEHCRQQKIQHLRNKYNGKKN